MNWGAARRAYAVPPRDALRRERRGTTAIPATENMYKIFIENFSKIHEEIDWALPA